MISNPSPPWAAVPADRAWQRATVGRAGIAGILLVADIGLALIGGFAWQIAADPPGSARDAASVGLMGGCAVAGLPVAVTIGLANVRALRARRAGRPLDRARRLAVVAQWLAVARVLGLVAATALLFTVVIQEVEPTDLGAIFNAALDAGMAALLAMATRGAIDRQPA
jgi:hypothetical protein